MVESGVKAAALHANGGNHAGSIVFAEADRVTGTIVSLTPRSRTGTIRTQNGSLFPFAFSGVLGDFDALAVGDRVSFDEEQARLHRSAERVFREPISRPAVTKKPDAPADLRYAGFDQAANVRSYGFDLVTPGHSARYFVTVDLSLLTKHRVGVQEAPALCMRKLAADLKDSPDSQKHQLCDADLLAFASLRAAALQRRKPKTPGPGRRGSPPPGPSNHSRFS